ncbi:MAG TPA: hypothetical protein VMV94_16250 [Phycisphaerae bacterium]|nr:hypothetical protein [Phycisphaerae bacterium]
MARVFQRRWGEMHRPKARSSSGPSWCAEHIHSSADANGQSTVPDLIAEVVATDNCGGTQVL